MCSSTRYATRMPHSASFSVSQCISAFSFSCDSAWRSLRCSRNSRSPKSNELRNMTERIKCQTEYKMYGSGGYAGCWAHFLFSLVADLVLNVHRNQSILYLRTLCILSFISHSVVFCFCFRFILDFSESQKHFILATIAARRTTKSQAKEEKSRLNRITSRFLYGFCFSICVRALS